MYNRPKKEEFFIHYEAIMPAVLALKENKITNQIKVFRDLSVVRSNNLALKFLLECLGKFKLAAFKYPVAVKVNLIKPNIAEARKLEVELEAMLEEETKRGITWLN